MKTKHQEEVQPFDLSLRLGRRVERLWEPIGTLAIILPLKALSLTYVPL